MPPTALNNQFLNLARELLYNYTVDENENNAAPFEIRAITAGDREWITGLLTMHWGSPAIVTRGKLHQADQLPGFVAVSEDEPFGLIIYRSTGGECEIISLNSLAEGIGIGTALLDAIHKAAIAARYKRLWLITTNDNLHALRFYQKYGFTIAGIHCEAIEESRRLKPEIPRAGIDGIPIRDEIEMEMWL
jgi:ribosomal protein S18 acetylase RimI-like enzyme